MLLRGRRLPLFNFLGETVLFLLDLRAPLLSRIADNSLAMLLSASGYFARNRSKCRPSLRGVS